MDVTANPSSTTSAAPDTPPAQHYTLIDVLGGFEAEVRLLYLLPSPMHAQGGWACDFRFTVGGNRLQIFRGPFPGPSAEASRQAAMEFGRMLFRGFVFERLTTLGVPDLAQIPALQHPTPPEELAPAPVYPTEADCLSDSVIRRNLERLDWANMDKRFLRALARHNEILWQYWRDTETGTAVQQRSGQTASQQLAIAQAEIAALHATVRDCAETLRGSTHLVTDPQVIRVYQMLRKAMLRAKSPAK